MKCHKLFLLDCLFSVNCYGKLNPIVLHLLSCPPFSVYTIQLNNATILFLSGMGNSHRSTYLLGPPEHIRRRDLRGRAGATVLLVCYRRRGRGSEVQVQRARVRVRDTGTV